MNTVSVDFLKVGHCNHLACMAVRDAACQSTEFPSYCALISHPTLGHLLFDTGYANHFDSACARYPEKLYKQLLPIHLPHDEQLCVQLQQRHILPAQIAGVIISHFHGDHVAGLKDFPKARFIASRADCMHLQSLGRWRATTQGILPGLLPTDFWPRVQYADTFAPLDLPGWMAPFDRGWDMAGDGSLLLIDLSGHSAGQLGLLLPHSQQGPVLLCADACWSLPACQRGALPSPLVGFFTANWRRYKHTFTNLSTLSRREPELSILPSHCPDAFRKFHGKH
ncbi:MBL fold metallo-hydrolase [Simiduia agarivorans]|uniref:Metallo-beta-lactamase domain-containing protein n=1 Tax=Simiduia agarivorans (strain DSM 21679 / JCM 13881 / BCRC 17597 / SA1) TaxID=1117647 RepID=K4KQ65_SIMAS|nr:MBL fold metallo-hydrolase [Simiduia agarivorans]AFV00416.1 metallo-beta-lactamase domain-containing protein [Simiduia agarivorans SA1 = DSM 21679]